MVTENPSDKAFLDKLEKQPVEVDQWQLEKLAMVTGKLDLLYYVPGIAQKDRETLWGQTYDSPTTAIAALLAELPNNARVAIIPEGPYVLAQAAEMVTA